MKNNVLLCMLFAFILTGCMGESSSSGSDSNGGVGGSMARFTIRDNYLYTVDNQTLKTIDISNPGQPLYLKGRDQKLGFDIETIFAMDTLLFIGSQSGMYIYDVTHPDLPQILSQVSHIRSCDPVVAFGNYAYVTLNSENTWCGRVSNVLQVYDISNTHNPVLKQTVTGFVSPRGLGVDGKKLFICDNGLKVYDITDPVYPRWMDDLTYISEASGIDTYDVIPLNGLLLVVGADGLYQFDYRGDKLKFVSKIEIVRQ